MATTYRKPITSTSTAPSAELVVTNIRPRMLCIAGLDIRPGETVTIPEEYADGVRKSTVFVAGDLAVGRVAVDKVIDLSRLPEDSALKIVSTETDEDTLALWAKDANVSDVVRKAIGARAKELA